MARRRVRSKGHSPVTLLCLGKFRLICPSRRRKEPDMLAAHTASFLKLIDTVLEDKSTRCWNCLRSDPTVEFKVSLREPPAHHLQFLPALCVRFGVSHLERFERIKDNLGYNQPSVLFVVGRNNIPRCVPGARRTEAFLIRRHVSLPELPLLNVRKADFPVLFLLIDALKETLSLLLLREVQIEFHDAGSVVMEMPLQIRD
jgi:hypothetical protein